MAARVLWVCGGGIKIVLVLLPAANSAIEASRPVLTKGGEAG